MIYEFQYRVLTQQELDDIKANSYLMDQVLSRCTKFCGNPRCKYPLPELDNYSLVGIGDVCNLCYTMYKVVAERAFFVRAEREANNPPSTPPI